MSIFPVVQQITSGRDSTASTSHAITMPTGITAGELILVIFASSGSPSNIDIASSNMTWLYTDSWEEESVYKFTCFLGYVESSGTKTLTISTSTSEEAVHIVYRISGVNLNDMNHNGYLDVTGYISASLSATTSINANPPSDSTYGLYGEQDYLFIVAAVTKNTVATAAPTNFGNLTTIASINPNNVALSTAHRSYRTGSIYDPGVFTTASDIWMALTINILPSLGCGTNYYRKYSGLPLSLGLKGYWKLDETSGNTLSDSVGTINLFTSGTVNQTGKLGKAVSLSGQQYIMASRDTDALVNFPNGMTFSCWLNLTSTPTTSYKIYNQYHNSYPWTTISLNVLSSRKISGAVVNSLNEVYYFQTNNVINTGVWYNITFTCSESSMRLYINGTEATYDWNDGFSSSIKQADSATFFGNEEIGGSYCFVGLLDELAIWDRPLQPGEVVYLYNSGSGRTYPF